MTDFQSALGYKQIVRYDKNLLLEKKAKIYLKNFKGNTNIKFQIFAQILLILFFKSFAKMEKLEINYYRF